MKFTLKIIHVLEKVMITSKKDGQFEKSSNFEIIHFWYCAEAQLVSYCNEIEHITTVWTKDFKFQIRLTGNLSKYRKTPKTSVFSKHACVHNELFLRTLVFRKVFLSRPSMEASSLEVIQSDWFQSDLFMDSFSKWPILRTDHWECFVNFTVL